MSGDHSYSMAVARALYQLSGFLQDNLVEFGQRANRGRTWASQVTNGHTFPTTKDIANILDSAGVSPRRFWRRVEWLMDGSPGLPPSFSDVGPKQMGNVLLVRKNPCDRYVENTGNNVCGSPVVAVFEGSTIRAMCRICGQVGLVRHGDLFFAHGAAS